MSESQENCLKVRIKRQFVGGFRYNVWMTLLTTKQIEQTRLLAMQTADCVMDFYRDGFEVSQKSDNSPVTQADLAASQLLERALPNIADYPVLSEENTPEAPDWQQWKTYWLIDPIDGTKHFINRTGDFCVCIALIHQHTVVFGLIIAPVTGEMWLAQHGDNNGVQKWLNGKPVILVANATPAQPTAVLSSPQLTERMQTLLQSLSPDFRWYRRGSALKYVDIVEGKATIYPKLWDTCEWDSAAGQCLLECSGGAVVRLDDGQPLRYGQNVSLLNPYFLAYRDLDAVSVADLLACARRMAAPKRNQYKARR